MNAQQNTTSSAKSHQINTDQVAMLFSAENLDGFELGATRHLLAGRNPHLGNLLLAERNIFYLQIAYRMLCFRREHELEPLFDDIFEAVRAAQETVADTPYHREDFLQDMRQLDNWDLLKCRVEKERLRGYRDVSRRKYRYRLQDDTITFLQWLEERLQEDLEDKGEDTRNLLFDVSSRLRETATQVNRFTLTSTESTAARTIIYLLVQLDDLTAQINLRISDMNANVLGFLISHYNVDQAKGILKELEIYVDSYLKQIYSLRQELLPNLTKLASERNLRKYDRCLELLDEERRQAPHMLKRQRRLIQPALILQRLSAFYSNSGQLDELCRRMNDSYIKVYKKLKAHLRELERKNNRLEDINSRLAELAAMPEQSVPATFMNSLLAHARQTIDPNYWDEHQKAAPPQPRLQRDRHIKTPKTYVKKRKTGNKPPLSIRQARLEQLKTWLNNHVMTGSTESAALSKGHYSQFNDIRNIFETMKNGLLQKGRNLNQIGFTAQPARPATICTTTADECSLTYSDMTITRCKENS